jgi:type II secretory pathway component PulC
MSALSFITKVEPPPAPVVTKAPDVIEVAEPIVEEKKALDFGYTLILISYDQKGGRHLAFLNKERKGTHPYLLGESVDSFPVAKIVEIHPDRVLLRSDDGREQTLTLEKKNVNTSFSKVNSVSSVKRTTPKTSSPPKTVKTTQPPKPTNNAKRQRRTVPQWRNVEVDSNYGISIVKYSPDQEGNDRFAISQKDLRTVQQQGLRLLSEVAPSVAYDDGGNAMGVRLDFVAEEPLAKQYGIRNGDVMTSLNGTPVRNEADAQSFYDSLGGNERVVKVGIQRGETKVNVIFEMDDFPGVSQQK